MHSSFSLDDIHQTILRLADQGRDSLLAVVLHDIRAATTDKHHVCDDTPYGGGGGMILKPEPIFYSVESVLGTSPDCPIILLSPQGRLFTQRVAAELASHDRLALICGRYEGVDERVREHLATDELSIGDYVLTGGEVPAMVIIDAVARYIPGVLGARWAAEEDSHAGGLLEGPHYTRPAEFRGWGVPEVLLSGDHARIERWRRQQSLRRTWERRPDLLREAPLTDRDLAYLVELEAGAEEE